MIDLCGAGKCGIRRIQFWYDTQGLRNGCVDVTIFGVM
jgi:hypothetical protein